MLKKLICFLLMFAFLINTFCCFAEEIIGTGARAAVVIDEAGKVLYEKNATQKLPMASTTKIMTAICALEFGDLNKQCKVSKRASMVEGSSMYLKEGEKITLEDLVTGLMLVSGNDAATAISENVSKSEDAFVLLMNLKASEIGVKNTCFQNPHGLPHPNHYTTAKDLARITAYAMKNEKFSKIVSQKSSKVAGRTLVNHNKLLRLYPDCIGVKTGFTKKAGRCLVTAAKRDDLTLICVTLNDGNDWNDHISLYEKGFDNFKAIKIADKGTTIAKARVYGGNYGSVRLKCNEDIVVSQRKNSKERFSITVPEKITLNAPIVKGEIYAKADLLKDGKKVSEINLVAEENIYEKVKKRSLFKDILLKLKRGFSK